MSEPYAKSQLPTAAGLFRIHVYRYGDVEHVALVAGDISDGRSVLCRVHSECLTGEVFGSLRCDCRQQLELSMAEIGDAGRGVFVYLRQEGRGIGLGNKIRAYALQDQGADTRQANLSLGFGADERDYSHAVEILNDLGVVSVALLTNNPAKVEGLRKGGIEVVPRHEVWAEPTAHNSSYLQFKQQEMGHISSDNDAA